MESNELGPEDVVLVDTNLFVSVGGVDHPKFRKLREFAERRQLTLQVPRRVKQELSTMHIADRVERAVDEGWAELIDPPSPTDPDAVTAMDFVRREIARQTGKEEHRVEKADTVFAGLAIELLREGNPRVAVLTDDRIAAAAIERAVEEQGHGESILVLRRDDVIDDDGDFRVI
jgi:predicted nucleic acid-binding protein